VKSFKTRLQEKQLCAKHKLTDCKCMLFINFEGESNQPKEVFEGMLFNPTVADLKLLTGCEEWPLIK
jgi:hypothetical protein